ncbi:uncharacterized protein L201_001962 [Kwoniella dendrophila CBS 6074]|uniref:Zn(2)-C6 fungal-type domain-containing protein n=1 Tax=Kwoniella dendrophila CBS 6074 TaxID=1295534 RepID=A0AAX4JNU2_9TREE
MSLKRPNDASTSSSSTPDVINADGNKEINVKPKATRSRNGCLVCRSRRLKCDLGKPECKRCVNYGAECVYPEKKPFNPNIVAEKLSKRHKKSNKDKTKNKDVNNVDVDVEEKQKGDIVKEEILNSLPSISSISNYQAGPSNSRSNSTVYEYTNQNDVVQAVTRQDYPNNNIIPNNVTSSSTTSITASTSKPLTPLSSVQLLEQPPSVSSSPTIHNTSMNNHIGSLPLTSAGQSVFFKNPTHFIQQMDSVELLMALCRDTRMGQFFGGPLDPPELLKQMFPVEEDLRCFHHALTYSLSILVVEEEPNPWVEHVARLFLVPTGEAPLSSEALKQGMLAMGAIHLSVLEARGSTSSSSGRTRELGLSYRWEAVKLLRQAKDIPEEVESDAFLACAVILGCDDILGANPHWREVIRLGILAIKKRGGCERILFPDNPYPDNFTYTGSSITPDKPVSPLLRLLIETLVIGDVGRSFSTGAPTIILTDSSTWWERLAPTDPSEADSCECTWGMHRSIPRLMTRVINLTCEGQDLERQTLFDFPEYEARISDRNNNGDNSHNHNSVDISIERTSPSSSSPSVNQTSTSNNLALTWSEEKKRWRQSFNFRINELRNDMSSWILNVPQTIKRKRTKDGSLASWHAFQILISRDLLKLPRSNNQIQKSADIVLDTLSQVGDKVEWLNFSLIITCTVLITPEQRQRAREVLRWFRVQCCYEIDVLESVAEECWKRIDDGLDDEACSWREILLEMGCSVLLG